MKTSKILFFVLFAQLLFLGSCKQNLIKATQPKASKNLTEAKSRLISVKKWTIDEFYLNNDLVYKLGQTLPENNKADVDLEYFSFKPDGVFEVKSINKPVDVSLRYKLDEANNKIQIYAPDEGENYLEDWSIIAGSVFSDNFEMIYEDIEIYNAVTDKNILKIKAKALKQ